MKSIAAIGAVCLLVLGVLYFRSGGQLSGGNFGTIYETGKGLGGQAVGAGEGYAVKIYNEPWFWSVTICFAVAVALQKGWSKLPDGVKLGLVAVFAAAAAIIVYKFSGK